MANVQGSWKNGFAFLGGAFAWFAHLTGTYAIGEFSCVMKGRLFVFLGLGMAGWLLALLSFAAIAVTLAAIVVCWRMQLAIAGRPGFDAKEGPLFISRAGLVMNLVFLVIIAAQIAPIFYLLGEC